MEPTRVLLRLPDRKIRKIKKLLPSPLSCQAEPGVPDPLLRATIRAAVRVAKGETPSVELMSAGANGLVRDAMQALAYKRWNVV